MGKRRRKRRGKEEEEEGENKEDSREEEKEEGEGKNEEEESNQKVHVSFQQFRKHVNFLPGVCAKRENSGIFTIYLTFLTMLQHFNIIKYENKAFIETV